MNRQRYPVKMLWVKSLFLRHRLPPNAPRVYRVKRVCRGDGFEVAVGTHTDADSDVPYASTEREAVKRFERYARMRRAHDRIADGYWDAALAWCRSTE